jgi:ATP-dependent Clp protease ATP-binding subunit ClpA
MLLGPTGTGKTKTVEALAEVLHGSHRNLLRIDCAEYQASHEIAKLVGAPPGYTGFRETQPVLTQFKVNQVASESCGVSLILFDEIEKANRSLHQILLGVMDKASLTLGDGSTVDFTNSIIFMSSNVGADSLQKAMDNKFGFRAASVSGRDFSLARLQSIGLAAARKRFSPEFINRLDHMVTYKPLTHDDYIHILENLMKDYARHVYARLATKSFRISATREALELLVERGTDARYGARELKRTLHKHFQQPLARLVDSKQIPAGCTVVLAVRAGEFSIFIKE